MGVIAAFIIAAVAIAAFGGPTWAWAVCFAAAFLCTTAGMLE